MVRIFTSLALFAVAMMIAALMVGLFVGDIHGVKDTDTLRWARVHWMLGVIASLVVVLVNCIGMTYFIGTGRWCKEVVETYELDPELIRRSVRLKRHVFPWSLFGILVIIGVAALGGAADPATGRQGTEWWVMPHLVGALAGLAFIAFSFFKQGEGIAAHHRVINDILAEVRRIRVARGLEV